MIQENELKSHVKEIIKKFIAILDDKKIKRGKLIQDEEIILQSLKNPLKGDIKLLIIVEENIIHKFIEDRRRANSYFVIMNDKEAKIYVDRRPCDYFSYTTIPEENYNIYLPSFQDINQLIQNPNTQKMKFYSIELGIVDWKQDINPKKETVVIDEKANIDDLTWDQKWELYKKLSDYDPRKKILMEQFFGFNLKYKKYKMPEEVYFITIEPLKIKETIGMIARDIYPINLRTVLRRDYIKDHNELVKYTKEKLEDLREQIDIKKEYFKNTNEYIIYLNKIKDEINYQISQLIN